MAPTVTPSFAARADAPPKTEHARAIAVMSIHSDYSIAEVNSTALLFSMAGGHHTAMLQSADEDRKHTARKLQWALENVAGLTPKALMVAFGAKQQSMVSEWLRTGRIAKEQIPVLADMPGTTDRWWLLPDAPIPPEGGWLANSGTNTLPFPARAAATRVPVSDDLLAKLGKLTDDQRAAVEVVTSAAILAVETVAAQKGGRGARPRRTSGPGARR